jgi:lysozyme
VSKQEKIILFTLAGLALILLVMTGGNLGGDFMTVLRSFIPSVEGFRSVPYWDNKQWTWGYGTRVPNSGTNPNVKPNVTITRDEAFKQMSDDLNTRYLYLKPRITTPLRPQQVAALLSFAYDEGLGAASLLLPQVNSGDLAALETHWKEYNKANGITSTDLVNRRSKEWQLYIS